MALALVLDASAVLRMITHDLMAHDCAEQLGQAPLVLAPELMLTGVANGLWKLRRSAGLAGMDPQQLLADATNLVDQVESDRHLQVEALALACHLNHPVYDCLDLALARREATLLVTADQRLRRLADQVLP
ncbi:PilT protein domain-containing protein [Cyanobium sp. Copco_Reservoir_LC18]|uniref:type II toxin-antitoxin system VapC family toxin n=1 Tax=Cyanobium sp. Copco_Reservoir_LC18 TaxID=1328305 RepID=UPI0016B2D113|nr:type II toxin-antitoxin system VapC family toxin [Cyanobium sp. Copco_Reservoir_LC18]KAF0652425.1 PilT protein domain-containing protein [Cyanobium sp. Copco_Reservoir_LC18]